MKSLQGCCFVLLFFFVFLSFTTPLQVGARKARHGERIRRKLSHLWDEITCFSSMLGSVLANQFGLPTVILGERFGARMMYFPTKWGAKEPQNIPQHISTEGPAKRRIVRSAGLLNNIKDGDDTFRNPSKLSSVGHECRIMVTWILTVGSDVLRQQMLPSKLNNTSTYRSVLR